MSESEVGPVYINDGNHSHIYSINHGSEPQLIGIKNVSNKLHPGHCEYYHESGCLTCVMSRHGIASYLYDDEIEPGNPDDQIIKEFIDLMKRWDKEDNDTYNVYVDNLATPSPVSNWRIVGTLDFYQVLREELHKLGFGLDYEEPGVVSFGVYMTSQDLTKDVELM